MKNFPLYILAGSLFILGLSLGFFAGRRLSPSDILLPSEQEETFEKPQQITKGLFSSQTATIRGEITKVEANNLTVKNLNSGATGNIIASMRLRVVKNGKTTPTTDFTSLDLNKEVLINLEMIGGNYQAVYIQYTQPLPSLPPIISSGQTSTPTTSSKP